MADNEKNIIRHYKSTGRSGKQIVDEEVKEGSDTAHFLARMELRRLSMACNITMDMRGKVPGECKIFEYEGYAHYLDDKCIEIFKTKAAEFDNKYTVGVFEAVQSAEHTFKAQHEKENKERLKRRAEREKQQAQVVHDPLFASSDENSDNSADTSQSQSSKPLLETELIPFGYRVQRKEQRLNYATEVILILSENTQITAKTSDVSVSGIKVILPREVEELTAETEVQIQYPKLEQQHRRKLGNVDYKVISQEVSESRKVELRLIRIFSEKETAFDDFLPKFIQAYISRYKIDLEDSLQALTAKVYERIYTLSTPTTLNLLHISPSNVNSLYAARRLGKQDSLRDHLLSSLSASLDHFFSPSKLQKLTKEPYILLESFVIKGNRQERVYCAERQTLLKDNTIDDFFNIATKAHFVARVLVSLQAVHHNDISLTKELMAPLTEVDPVRAESLLKTWESTTHIAYLSLVEEKLNPESTLNNQSEQLASLKNYQLKPNANPIWQLGYRQQRKEERFVYKSEVIITADNKEFSANTVDFSPGGLKVELSTSALLPTDLKLGASVTVNMPELQKIAKKTASLTQVPYKIVGIHHHQNAISLKTDYSDNAHQGESFFSRLIANNKDKLQECHEEIEFTVKAEMLESMFSLYLNSLPFFIGRYPGGKYSIRAAGVTDNISPLLWQFKQGDYFDFSSINLMDYFYEQIKPRLSRKGQLEAGFSTRFFATFPPQDATVKSDITVVPESAMPDAREIAKFILKARKNPRYRILKAHFLPPPYMRLEEFSEELGVIRKNAANQAKKFEQALSQLIALMELEDLTPFYLV
ncbi:PilZ domain-containing protein [Pleionea sp. CnH1-48]|uniref:PilZ domain-containing protein n=1 Tax=Pleionea sp. CnH1-48 TaxID=2954494 RepID=UPI0020973CE9|nr:PilZ domain-containing protein [Pleionea sp. CnH1-48]MCO7225719.1 PilZ domain-containing protein [Pleionea sp. CnH1-48]